MLIDVHSHIDRYEESLELALGEINKHKIFTISNSMDIPSFEAVSITIYSSKMHFPI
jgi:hypothetical protein